MLSPYQQEMLAIIRRAAERGLMLHHPESVDLFQHILDELKRIHADT